MKPSVLIIEDDAVARAFAGRILSQRYEVAFAADAHEARGKLIGGPIDLVLCDIHLPGENGMDLVESMLSRRDEIAVVMVTSDEDPGLVDKAFGLGAYGYLVKPYREGDLLITASNAMRRKQLEAEARAHERELEQHVIAKSLEAERIRQLLRHSQESLERSRLETVHKLSLAVEMRDQVTGHHVSRMGAYCEEIARRIKLSGEICESIALAGQMHDIGKVAVPDHILLKAGPLTREEREQMQAHAEIGRKILQGSESPLLQLAETIAWTHHERIDGSGYPRGLSGDEIPIAGRIAAVADVFDALTRDRPYRRAMPVHAAAELMSEGRGKHFDPLVLDTLMSGIPAAEAQEHA
jgi:putative two-component system response regulator